MKKQSLTQIFSNWDVKYICEYDYDSDRNNCECEQICRCSTITNAHITEVISFDNFLEIFGKDLNDFQIYFLDRIYSIRKIWDKDNYIINTCRSYYGEEIDNVKLETNLLPDIDFFVENKDNNKALMEYLLNAEYGFILESLKSKEYEIKTVSYNDLFLPNENYWKKIQKDKLTINYNIPIGLYIQDGNRYKLCDGYTRFCSLDKTKPIKIMVAK